MMSFLEGNEMETFDRPEQHDQYLAWIAAHPNGFVLHFNKPRGDTVLHTANCYYMTTLIPPAQFHTSYRKICSDNVGNLRAIAPTQQNPTDCRFCQP
jgi:hypothetical protein